MGDVQRIVRLPDGGRKRTQVLLDLADLTAFTPTRGSWQYTPPAKKATSADANRRYGGSHEVANAHDNALLTRSIIVKGANADATLANIERLKQELEDFEGKFFEWRPDGASRSVYMELRGVATVNDKYANPQFAQGRSIEVEVAFPIAPLGRGDALDFAEDWSGTNPIADYTDRTNTNAVQILGGQLAPNGSLGQLRRLIFTARGHLDRDATREASFIWGSTLASQVGGVVIELDNLNYVRCYLFDNGTDTRIYIESVVAGASVQTFSSTLTTRLVAGQQVWVRGRAEGLVCIAEVFTAPPGPATAPAGAYTTALTLATAGEKAIVASAGRGGIYWAPQSADARVVSYVSRPWSWKLRSLPELESLRDVPGTAPPLFEAHLTPSGGAAAPIFALLGWWRRPATFNWCWNGGFENGVDGWSATDGGLTLHMNNGTSVAPLAGTPAAPAKYGTKVMLVTTPATVGTGATFPIYRRFRKGVTYTIQMWVRQATGTANPVQPLIASLAGGGSDAGGGAYTNASAGLTLISTTWTPGVDIDVAVAAFRTQNATAATFHVDGVVVYEGTTAPTTNQHAEGEGAFPPVGLLRAAAQDQANLSGWAPTADAGYLGGYGLKVTTSGAGIAGATWLVDPALLQDDDFSDGTLHVEVWAVIEIAAGVVSPRLNVSCLPESGVAAERTSDWGSVGKAIVKPSAGSAKRPVRIGVLRFPTADQQRWRLKLSAAWGASSAGVFGVDYLWLVPGRNRAASPSAKANDASYPDFVPSTAEITRRILSNLSGQTIKEPGYPSADTGLGGTPLELPAATPGQTTRDVDVVVKLSSLVPDDPTLDTTTEQLNHSATCHFSIVPRYFLTRSS